MTAADESPTKSQLKVQEYRTRAQEALTVVEGPVLEHVREQWRRSAAMWTEMAEAEEARMRRLRLPPPGL